MFFFVIYYVYYDFEVIFVGYSVKCVFNIFIGDVESFSNCFFLVVIIDNSIGIVRFDDIERVRRIDIENVVV